jgi:uncharacterized protein YecA (UPF0149 family)
MTASLIDAFLDADAGLPFAAIRKDAKDILAAFLEAAERKPDALDAASVDAALQSVIPRMKKQRLADAAPLFAAFIGFAGEQAGLKDAGPLAAEARTRAGELATEDEKKRRPVQVQKAAAGRNDPCPCGSGKKYKKCCGA